MDRGRLFAATRLNSDSSWLLAHKPSSVATRIFPEDSKKDVTWGSTIRALAAGRSPGRAVEEDLRLGIACGTASRNSTIFQFPFCSLNRARPPSAKESHQPDEDE